MARSRRDHGSIGPRSWYSSTSLLHRLMKLQLVGRSRSLDPVRHDREEGPPPAVRSVRRSRPSDGSTSDEVVIKSLWRSDVPGASTCHQVSLLITFHLCPFCSTCFDEDRVDCGPRDRRFARRSNACAFSTSPAYWKCVRT